MPRLFIASPVPEKIRLQIEAAAAPLRRTLPPASWTRPEAFHLTFAFLGDQDQRVIEPLSRELDRKFQGQSAFNVSIAFPGFFPDERRPRVAWVGLTPREPLVELAQLARDAVRAEKISFDEKPYVPHLTLARLRDRWSNENLERFRAAFSSQTPVTEALTSVVLFQSQLSSQGAIHTPLHRVELSR